MNIFIEELGTEVNIRAEIVNLDGTIEGVLESPIFGLPFIKGDVVKLKKVNEEYKIVEIGGREIVIDAKNSRHGYTIYHYKE